MSELFDQRFPADLSRMADLRRAMRERLATQGVASGMLDRLTLVVDEIVSNSIEHGVEYRSSSAPIRVRVEGQVAGLLLVVEDLDAPVDLVLDLARVLAEDNGSAPSAVVERGRGMFLITMMLEDLEVMEGEDGGLRLQGRLDAGDD